VQRKKERKMGNTIYASFADASLAEKAAGALLDNGVRSEDISVVRNHTADTYNDVSIASSTSGQDYTNRDLDQNTVNTNPGQYTTTGSTGTWTGSSLAPENEGRSYTGSVYGTDVATGDATDISTLNTAYGDTAYRTENLNDSNRNNEGDYEKAAKEGISTTTGADAGAGAIKGAGWGLGIGILAGIASLAVPGVGLVLGGGALAAAIGGAAATTGAGAIAGGVTGYLKDQGMDEHIAANYDNAIRSGGAMIAVTLPSGDIDEARAREILEKYGAGNVSQYASRGYVA
jgi:hypothetical protein